VVALFDAGGVSISVTVKSAGIPNSLIFSKLQLSFPETIAASVTSK
jgi:hypothetical protein